MPRPIDVDYVLQRANLGDLSQLEDGRFVITGFHLRRPDDVEDDVTDLCEQALAEDLIKPSDDGTWRPSYDGHCRIHDAWGEGINWWQYYE